ncbi:hypothetical protein FACS1894103_0100 [Campylobacterota bacterium]|nr:hypothetical protein FACS1894103_0100 [Campylobacterota bacterium]
MKFARGFKKRYFSLKAIAALASQIKVSRALERVVHSEIVLAFSGKEAKQEDETPLAAMQIVQCAAALLLVTATVQADISIDTKNGAAIAQKNASDIDLKNQLNQFSKFTNTSSQSLGTIEGAPSRFTKLYWEGIRLSDTAGITAEPAYANNMLLSSDSISILDNAIYVRSDTKQESNLLIGASNKNDRFVSGKIKIDSLISGMIELENKTSKNRSSVAKTAGKLDTRSEEDSLSATTVKTVLHFAPTDRLDMTLKALDAVSKEDYDGGFPADPNDNASYWDSHLMIGGLEASYLLAGHISAKIGANYTKLTRIDSDQIGANHDKYIGKNRTVFGEAKTVFNDMEFSVGIENSFDEAQISSQLDDQSKETDIYAASIINISNHRFDIKIADNILHESSSISYDASWKAFVGSVSFGIKAKKEVNAPTIYQKVNPFGAPNTNLTHEELEQKRVFIAFDTENISLQTAVFKTDIYDYINWVDDIDWTKSHYDNVDKVSFNGLNLFAKFYESDHFAIGSDYTKLFKYNATINSVENRQAKSVVTVFANYQIAKWFFGAEFRGTSSYIDGASNKKMEGERTNSITAAYTTDDHLTIELAVKNVQDEYRETIYGYTPNTPERTVFLTLKKSFNAN